MKAWIQALISQEKNYLSEERTRLAMVGESFPGIHGFDSAQKTNKRESKHGGTHL